MLWGIPLIRPEAALVAIQFRSPKLVVSTTSVSPSQRPRESPSKSRTVGGSGGRSSSGMIRASWIISEWITTKSFVCTIW